MPVLWVLMRLKVLPPHGFSLIALSKNNISKWIFRLRALCYQGEASIALHIVGGTFNEISGNTLTSGNGGEVGNGGRGGAFGSGAGGPQALAYF